MTRVIAAPAEWKVREEIDRCMEVAAMYARQAESDEDAVEREIAAAKRELEIRRAEHRIRYLSHRV